MYLICCIFSLHFQAVTDTMLGELKSCFMEAYDDNQDGKIDIREVSVKCPHHTHTHTYFPTSPMYPTS